MPIISYEDSESWETIETEESDNPSTEYINEVCKNNGWVLEDILDIPDGNVIVVVTV